MSIILNQLKEEFGKFPGIGSKTAQKLALHIIKSNPNEIDGLINALNRAKTEVKFCNVCGNFSETDVCPICRSERRNKKIVCIVQETNDVMAIENIREYQGVYHVLRGALSPIDGIGPDQLNIQSLIQRLNTEEIEEIILATNPDTKGESTAVYISRLIKQIGIPVRITKLAYGLSVGSTLDYADEITLGRALSGRSQVN